MTDNPLEKVKVELRGLSDDMLDEIFLAVFEELQKRKPKCRLRPKSQGWALSKDGEPIHGE